MVSEIDFSHPRGAVKEKRKPAYNGISTTEAVSLSASRVYQSRTRIEPSK